MRLLTHNFLACHAKSCRDLTTSTYIPASHDAGGSERRSNYPLGLSQVTLEEREAEFNADFIRRMKDRVIWTVFVNVARELGNDDLPNDEPSEVQWRNDDFCQAVHKVLLELHVVNGFMTCPNCKHVYPIKDGIPNMLLGPDEV